MKATTQPQPVIAPELNATSAKRVLLASEGRPFPEEAIQFAADLARRDGATVNVFSIARIWGTSLGLPNPGLLPTRREWDTQHAQVEKAVKSLLQKKIKAEGCVIGTRNPSKRIIAEAKRMKYVAIIMAAEAPKNWLISSLLWSQEAYRIRKRAGMPVHIVQIDNIKK
jgi:hypothetical protein